MAVIVDTEDFYGSEIVLVSLTPTKKRIVLLSVTYTVIHVMFLSVFILGKSLEEPFELILNIFIFTFWAMHLWVTVLFLYRLHHTKNILSIRANLLESRNFFIPIAKIKEITIIGDSVFFAEYARVKVLMPLKVEKVTYTYGFVSKKDLHNFINCHIIPRNYAIKVIDSTDIK